MSDADLLVDKLAKYMAETYNGGSWEDASYYTEEQKEKHRKRAEEVLNIIAKIKV